MTESKTKPSESKKSKKVKYQLSTNEYIQNALEKSLIDIQYWENWRELLGRLGGSLQRNYRNEDISKALDTLYSAIYVKEHDAWSNSFMWALGQSDTTRRKILAKAKERFLISDREHHSYEIMSHLDPRTLVDAEFNEDGFRKAIRNYFALNETPLNSAKISPNVSLEELSKINIQDEIKAQSEEEIDSLDRIGE